MMALVLILVVPMPLLVTMMQTLDVMTVHVLTLVVTTLPLVTMMQTLVATMVHAYFLMLKITVPVLLVSL
jgi:hypothetical protein